MHRQQRVELYTQLIHLCLKNLRMMFELEADAVQAAR